MGNFIPPCEWGELGCQGNYFLPKSHKLAVFDEKWGYKNSSGSPTCKLFFFVKKGCPQFFFVRGPVWPGQRAKKLTFWPSINYPDLHHLQGGMKCAIQICIILNLYFFESNGCSWCPSAGQVGTSAYPVMCWGYSK